MISNDIKRKFYPAIIYTDVILEGKCYGKLAVSINYVKNGHPQYDQFGSYGSKLPDKFKSGGLRLKLPSLAKRTAMNVKEEEVKCTLLFNC